MNAMSKPSQAYNVIDHTYDVVVVGAGGAGVAGDAGHGCVRVADGLPDQGVPDAEPHGGGAGRHWRSARQYGRG